MSETQELPAPCSCAIDCHPATTSIIDCAEHGMPQNLDDTEFPGSTPKVAITIARRGEVAIVAPLYTTEQAEQAKALATGLGYKVQSTTQICSLADLERIAAATPSGKQPPSLQYHRPGCIFEPQPHPGDCYIESLPGPSGTRDGDPAL